MKTAKFRPIQKADNAVVAKIVRSVLEDFGVPKIGTAYADKSLDNMFEAYENSKAAYFVVELDGRVVGGAGIAQLENYDGSVCELQKMYFLPEARGLGIGSSMISLCLQKAKELGYERCYLETMPYMIAAQKLYERSGFKYIDGPMGDTGHYACKTHMLKTL